MNTQEALPLLHSGAVPTGNVRTYEYGVRLDSSSREVLVEQIQMSRRLYNNIIARMRAIYDEMQSFVIHQAGDTAINLSDEVGRLTAAFQEAKARDDEAAMKHIAESRRAVWKDLSAVLKGARAQHRSTLQKDYLGRIGRNASCDTYKLRCEAVAGGLGWATANAVLDAALLAWKRSMQLGKPPRFAISSEKEQDTLTLQFTAAGGVAVERILNGSHSELALLPKNGSGPRKYGEFRFRLGSAKAHTSATGTWQYHRPLPEGASISSARLVRRRIGKDYRYAIQLVVTSELVRNEAVAARKPMVCVHFGWAADIEGRRVAGIADSQDPGAARILSLPATIEQDLERAAFIQGERDDERNKIIPNIKAMVADLLAREIPEDLREVANAIRLTQPTHVSANRLHYFARLLMANDCIPDWFETWRKADRMRWQSHTHIARRARNARRDFYRNCAIDLARSYDTVVLEPLDLAKAAQKVDEASGAKGPFGRKARSGRVVAALYELESALRWATVKTHSALLEISAPTASTCSICGGATRADEEVSQILHCDACGAELDRKRNGAALAYQHALHDREQAVTLFWTERIDQEREARATKQARQEMMIVARRNARTSSEAERAGGSRLSGQDASDG